MRLREDEGEESSVKGISRRVGRTLHLALCCPSSLVLIPWRQRDMLKWLIVAPENPFILIALQQVSFHHSSLTADLRQTSGSEGQK